MGDLSSLEIEQLRTRLQVIEEKYVEAVRSHEAYVTLRSLRDEMHNVKEQISQLEKMENPT
jgi:hypothetical protein